MLQNLLLSVLLVFTSTSIYRQPNTHQNTPQRGVYGTYTHTQPTQSTYRGFGYGSQRAYQSPMTFQVDGTYYSQPNQYYGTTYDYGNGSTGRPGGVGPKRISVHNCEGGTENTPGGNSDSEDWLYQYDEATGEWWCSKDGGVTWQKWDSLWGWGLIGFGWRPGRGDPSDNATHYHSDPNNPWVTPVGDVPIPLFITFLGAYYVYQKRKKLVA